MSFDPPPATAAWLHREARSGFEMVHFGDTEGGFCLEGRTAAIESRHAWVVDYEINLNHQWVTRVAAINSRTALGIRSTVLEADGHGQWRVDGETAPQLEGCLGSLLCQASQGLTAYTPQAVARGCVRRVPVPLPRLA